MAPTRIYIFYFKYLLIITAVFLLNFACAKKGPSDKIAVKISDYSLTAGEFNELFAEFKSFEDTPRAREAFLDNLITRKLLLQEAQRKGLDKQKDFLKSIENFWEQSLLKIIMDRKTKEISRDMTATEQELRARYNKWLQDNPNNPKTFDELGDIIKWHLLKEKETIAINSWIDGLKNKAIIEIDKRAIGIE